MDIFAVHGLAGMIGLLINGFFGVNYVPALDGLTLGDAAIRGGWFNHNWIQVPIQIAYIGATSAYSFVVTMIILYVMNLIPWFRLRVSREAERDGIDEAELGEFAFDFVEVRRDFDSWNAPDPNVIEGRGREELEKQEELANASTSSGATRYSADNNKTGTEGEGRVERALDSCEALPSGRGGGEIEVVEKSKAL